MNKVILVGNLCKDVEVRVTPSGTSVVRNSIAVKNNFKNSEGEYDTEFISIVAWRNTAEILKKYTNKGSKILVEGRLTNRTYDKDDGTRGYISEVVTERIELLGSKQKEDVTPYDFEPQEQEKNYDPFADFGSTVVIDDDFLD